MSNNEKPNKFVAIVRYVLLTAILISIACFAFSDKINVFVKNDKAEIVAIKESEETEASTTESSKVIVSESSAITQNVTESEENTNSTKNIEKAETPILATRSKVDRIMFCGDVNFSRKVKIAYDNKGLDGILDNSYKSLLLTSDFNVGNLEGAIIDMPDIVTADETNIDDENETNESKEYYLFTNEKYAKVLKEAKFDLFTLANNHILDFGVDALLNTMARLKELGINYIGAGANIDEAKKYFVKNIDGKKYAFFAASAVIPDETWKASENPGVNNGYDIATICREIKSIKDSVDKIIVYMHWGEELSSHSNESQRALAHKLVDFGADLVVGSHPHIVQEVEYYKDTPIVYSLGNFIYGATKRETMLLEATFDYSVNPKGFLLIRLYPGISNYEKVSYYWQEDNLKSWCKSYQNICDTCFIGDNGYVFTIEAVNKALGKTATDSEVSENDVKEGPGT